MAINRTTMRNDNISGRTTNDALSGDYGNDVLRGGRGNDQLDGGRGNDRLNGGRDADVIVSQSDGGEGVIAQDISNTGIDAASRRIYPNQAGLPADDVLTGGAGADEFRFQTLINAKADIIGQHVDANGVIDWAGVAGENNNVHDHWVDVIGNDVITDFNTAQGDKITITGHTTEVYNIEITDADGDGQADDTVLHLQSNQGNAGAHHLDQLGTISVLNNELTADDFTVDANSTAGIVENISQLDEAISPYNPNAGTQVADAGARAASGAGTGQATETGGMTMGGHGMSMGGGAAGGQIQASGGAAVSRTTSMGNDVIAGGRGADTLAGDYGNDVLRGGRGSDELDGGRGNDRLQGGRGQDVVVSQSDGGETAIAQDISDTGIDAASRRIYPNQAGLPADDVLTGGAGADEFRFQTLINAKREILEKHADANGVIDYAAVAGENNNVHDHWVDGIGDDVITDFNKAQGDKITITGHTTEVYQIDIADADNDGQADDSVLHLRSNQGNAGAHHLDLLGTISVLNNELTADDFTVDANSTAGIVENISQLDEAVSPYNPGAGDLTSDQLMEELIEAEAVNANVAAASQGPGAAAGAAASAAAGAASAGVAEGAMAHDDGAAHACGDLIMA